MFKMPTTKKGKALLASGFLAGFLTLATVINSNVVQVWGSTGMSMYPAMQENEIMLVQILRENPQKGDIVVAYPPRVEYPMIKRITGAAGDTVIRKSTGETITLRQDEFWLTSDAEQSIGHRRLIDSNDYGPVTRERIRGVILWHGDILSWALDDSDERHQFEMMRRAHAGTGGQSK